MRVKVFLEITADDGSVGGAAEVAVFEKQTERPEDLGLSIADGKALTAAVQQHIVDAQLATWAERHRRCEAYGARRHSKGSHPVIFMTLYGNVKKPPVLGSIVARAKALAVRRRGRLCAI
jgi:hypothetical protein